MLFLVLPQSVACHIRVWQPNFDSWSLSFRQVLVTDVRFSSLITATTSARLFWGLPESSPYRVEGRVQTELFHMVRPRYL
jgi:hypothetical protein